MIVTIKKANKIIKKAHKLYSNIGASAVYDYANTIDETYNAQCNPCDAETPHVKTDKHSECLLCGCP